MQRRGAGARFGRVARSVRAFAQVLADARYLARRGRAGGRVANTASSLQPPPGTVRSELSSRAHHADLQLISVHDLVHELLPTDATHA